jgi:hypothetical protein
MQRNFSAYGQGLQLEAANRTPEAMQAVARAVLQQVEGVA